MAKIHSRLIWFILLALLAFTGYLYWVSQQETEGQNRASLPVAVSTVKVSTKPMIRNVTALGTGIANNSAQIISPTSDFIIELNVREGKAVKKGEVIARLHDVQEKARVAELENILADQMRQLERLKNLATTQATAQSLLDEQQTKVNTTFAQLDVAKAQLAEMTIRAPFNGYMGLRQVSEGAYITSGTQITTLDELQNIKVAFSVAEHYLSEIQVGMPITVTNSAYGSIPFRGQVAAIDTRLDPVTRTVTVHGVLPNNDLRLRPGMLLHVKLELSNQSALQIPEKAVLPLQNRHYVFIVDENNVVTQKEITIGERIPGWVEILNGVEEGEEVVSEGLQKIRTGLTVNKVGN